MTAIVTGASRGFGRAIAAALHSRGDAIVGLGRDATALDSVRDQLGEGFTPLVADVTDADVATSVLSRHRPSVVVLNAGASTVNVPIQSHTWETFSRHWEVDAKQAFVWIQAALALPLAPGSTVIAMSSGAAVKGSPLSGGYAPAKAAVRFVTRYGAEESERAGLGIRFVSVLPQLTPATGFGAEAVEAYARRAGVDVATFLERSGPTLTSDQVAAAVVELANAPAHAAGSFLLTPAGLSPVP
jgi:NAD(P)-dependent dehydrogenase (short-subunit alcohol dehydrogenase family)